jgi:hypothetical protein
MAGAAEAVIWPEEPAGGSELRLTEPAGAASMGAAAIVLPG